MHPPDTANRLSATAFVAPFIAFVSFLVLPDLFRVENPELPWWRRAPELWIYPLQTVVCLAVLIHFRKNYTFRPASGFVFATGLGLLGIAFWITPSLLPAETGVLQWLGFTARTEGFDPTDATSQIGFVLTVGLRFLRMVVCVPLIEEIFWRGYVMRVAAAPDRPFHEVPFGTHTWPAYWITTFAFVAIHHHHDYLGAAIYGSLTYLVAVRTKSLTACVIMHAVANLGLGLYVMKTQQWGFW